MNYPDNCLGQQDFLKSLLFYLGLYPTKFKILSFRFSKLEFMSCGAQSFRRIEKKLDPC